LERLFRPLVAALATPLAIEVLSLTAEDDRVVAQLQGRSKLRAGVPYDNTYCFVFRFAGTHVVEVTEYLDTALVARAFTVPADALRERGFMELVAVPGMALLADPGTRCEPPGLVVRRVRDDQGRRDYLEVTAEAYATFQQSREMTEDTFAALESLRAPHIQG